MQRLTVYIAFIAIFLSCDKKDDMVLNFNDVNLKLQNGILFYQGDQFNGTINSTIIVNKMTVKTKYINGVKHGEEIKKYDNDSIAEIRHYTNGMKSNVHEGWWPDGTKKFVFHFNDMGEYHGAVKEWYPSGQIFKDFNYFKGKETGSQKMWQPDGKIRANYEVKNGERYGLIGLKKCYSLDIKSETLKITK